MFSKRIEEARTIAIGGHVRPDGDCTGPVWECTITFGRITRRKP